MMTGYGWTRKNGKMNKQNKDMKKLAFILLCLVSISAYGQIDTIANLEGGLSVRTKLNRVIDTINDHFATKDTLSNYVLNTDITGYAPRDSVVLQINDTAIIAVACSDETTALTTGTKLQFNFPFDATITDVQAYVNDSTTGDTLIVDINEDGVSILTTKLHIDPSEKKSSLSSTAVVIGDADIARGAEITIDIDRIGSSEAGAGLKVYIYYIKQ